MRGAIRWIWAVCVAAAALVPVTGVMAQQASQTTPRAAVEPFAPTIMVGGETLRINGRGLRERLFVKIYEVALYTPSGQVRDPEDLYKGDKPFRLRFMSLRENDGSLLGKLLTEGMQKNAPPDKKTLTMKYSLEMIDIFSTQQEVPSGQSFHIDYVPGKGTTFYINEIARGKPVLGHEFAPLLLGIWMGPQPASDALKAQLLGRPVPVQRPATATDVRG